MICVRSLKRSSAWSAKAFSAVWMKNQPISSNSSLADSNPRQVSKINKDNKDNKDSRASQISKVNKASRDSSSRLQVRVDSKVRRGNPLEAMTVSLPSR